MERDCQISFAQVGYSFSVPKLTREQKDILTAISVWSRIEALVIFKYGLVEDGAPILLLVIQMHE